jgi:hypothetical protein
VHEVSSHMDSLSHGLSFFVRVWLVLFLSFSIYLSIYLFLFISHSLKLSHTRKIRWSPICCGGHRRTATSWVHHTTTSYHIMQHFQVQSRPPQVAQASRRINFPTFLHIIWFRTNYPSEQNAQKSRIETGGVKIEGKLLWTELKRRKLIFAA